MGRIWADSAFTLLGRECYRFKEICILLENPIDLSMSIILADTKGNGGKERDCMELTLSIERL